MSEDAGDPRPPDREAHPDKDRSLLHALGYAQELRRGMSGFSNFAISFTIILILSGTLTLYGTGSTTAVRSKRPTAGRSSQCS
jgi:hypothetical protein